MRASRLLSATALAAAFVSTAASADTGERWPRWYVGLSAGMQFLSDSDLRGATAGDVEFDNGFVATAALGYMPAFGVPYMDNLRLEFEGGYHTSPLQNMRVGGVNTALGGNITAVSYMGNLFYDFRNASRWSPYIGAGAGLANIHLPRTSGLGNTENSDNTFAYQLMAGVGYSPASIPLTEWTLGYRFFSAGEPEFNTAGASKLKVQDINAHSVELGAKFRF